MNWRLIVACLAAPTVIVALAAEPFLLRTPALRAPAFGCVDLVRVVEGVAASNSNTVTTKCLGVVETSPLHWTGQATVTSGTGTHAFVFKLVYDPVIVTDARPVP